MKVYLVGGAVRDRLLGRPVKERDWVVVGATPEELIRQGYRPVGKDFPVFLHPETQEEYALARTERKTAPGYTGFSVHAAPDVTLEEDLARRDLTINAMAETPDGDIIDPFGGRDDLARGGLRHVSPAFAEDPVRILRAARFAARYGFHVEPDTRALMRRMVAAGEVDALVPERVWSEFQRALGEAHPLRFFAVLAECGALAALFPEVAARAEAAGSLAAGLPALVRAVPRTADPRRRFGVLGRDLATGEAAPGAAVMTLSERLRAPNVYRHLALDVARHHGAFARVAALSPEAVLSTLQGVDALRRPERLEDFVAACAAAEPDAAAAATCSAHWRRLRDAAAGVDARDLAAQGLQGPAIGEALRERRLTAIAEACAPG